MSNVVELLGIFLQSLLKRIIFIVNIILFPVDTFVANSFPAFYNTTVYITDMLQYALTYVNYVLDSFGFESITILFLVSYLIFKVTLPLQIWFIKLAVRWYNAIKPQEEICFG